MKDRILRLLPLFLLTLCSLLALSVCEAQIVVGDSEQQDTSSKPSSPIPQHPNEAEQHDGVSKVSNGADLFERAYAIFQQLSRASSPTRNKPSGVVGTTIYYAKDLLPRLYMSGPPPDSSSTQPTGHGRLRGPLAEGVGLLERAAQLSNPDAIYLLAQMNFFGNYTYPTNYTEAFRRYSALADLNGNSSAQHMVGFLYATGLGDAVERDQAKALLYHTFAARQGHTKSEMTLAFRHHSGIGTPRNCDESARYYKKVADKAIKWYRSGPPGGRAWVTDSYRLADEDGGVYGEGASASSSGINAQKGGPNSDAYAALDDILEYLDLLSRRGDFKATFSLGRIHYDGQKGLARNMKKARQYFHLVAKLYWTKDGRIIESDKPGLEKFAAKAAGYIGKMYLRGEGVEQNFEKALGWFQRGVNSADAGSQHGMGVMSLYGLAVQKNALKATEYFKAAADQDYAPSQVNLGALHLDQGQPSDIQVAGRYFEFAARYGHIEAYYYLAELTNQGLGRDRSCGLATAYYKNVAEKSEPFLSSFAEANTAYDNGDYELALVDYMMAAEQGYEKGQANVAYLLDQEKSGLPLSSILPNPKQHRSSLLRNAALALIYWTRSAKQTNIDSMVKMGDYYLRGAGTAADMEKAAACYAAASEFHQSAQALYNLGWMHENGVGLRQDFHLAKRYYDQALETNEEAYLPVTLSLFKLRLRSAWNTITHGRINSIRDEPIPKKQWSLGEWISNFLQDEHPYFGDTDYDGDLMTSSGDAMPGGDVDDLYDDLMDDGILESFIIIGLVAALLFLIYYRQQQQVAHRRQEEAARAQNGGQAPPPPQQQPAAGAAPENQRGLFPAPDDPAFGQWIAGGAGQW